jgi:hypothetical protein
MSIVNDFISRLIISVYNYSDIFYNFFRLAENVVAAVTNITMLMVLAGISIAATSGDNSPCTAKLNPIILYTMEMIKLQVITFFPDRAY